MKKPSKEVRRSVEQWSELFRKDPRMAIAHASWISERLLKHEAESHEKIVEFINQIDAAHLKIERLQSQLRRLRQGKEQT